MTASHTLPQLVALLWAQRRTLVTFAILFRLIESLLFAPLAGLAGQALSGRAVVDSTSIVAFALSPRGFLALLLGAVSLLTIRLVEHAGLSVIAWGAMEGKRVSARAALWYIAAQLTVLMRICARYVAVGVAVSAPLLFTATLLAKPLLAKHDINFYLAERPAEFILAAAVIALVALGCAIVALRLVVRWRWSVQTCLLEGRTVPEGFAASAVLTNGIRGRIAMATITSTLFSAGLGLAASLLGSAASAIALRAVDSGALPLTLVFLLLWSVRTAIGGATTLAGSCVDAGLFTALYRERRLQVGGPIPEIAALDGRASLRGLPPIARWLAGAATVGVAGFAGAGVVVAAQDLQNERPVVISAHRGDTTRAPENTLTAMRDAADAGADYLETDVQLSKDGVLVINHDSDFSRVGGVARKVWELTYEEIRAIPLGQSTEHVPTLDELLLAAKGRLKLNLELKYYDDHQPGLAAKVVESVRRCGMLDQVVIQSLEYEPLLEVKALAPEVPVGYLMSVNARRPARLDVDFLSVEQGRADLGFVLRAHRRGQDVHVWTVNSAEDLNRAFALGVDGVITDAPALAFELRRAYGTQSPSERITRSVEAWMRG